MESEIFGCFVDDARIDEDICYITFISRFNGDILYGQAKYSEMLKRNISFHDKFTLEAFENGEFIYKRQAKKRLKKYLIGWMKNLKIIKKRMIIK